MLRQRWDFPLEKRIEMTDRLPTTEGEKPVETTVRFSIWQKIWNDGLNGYSTKPKKRWNNGEIFCLTKELKQQIDCLQLKAKNCSKNG